MQLLKEYHYEGSYEKDENGNDKTFRIYLNDNNFVIFDPEKNTNFNELNSVEIETLYENNPSLNCFHIINIENIESLKKITFNGYSLTDDDEYEECWIKLEIIKLSDSIFLFEWIYSNTHAGAMSYEYYIMNEKCLFDLIDGSLKMIV